MTLRVRLLRLDWLLSRNDVLRLLQKIYLIIYGWQDKLIYFLDGFKKIVDPLVDITLTRAKTELSKFSEPAGGIGLRPTLSQREREGEGIDMSKCYLSKQFMKWVSLL